MLEIDFQLPDKEESVFETKKRNELLKWFVDDIHECVTGLVVAGSMGYGQNYSVTKSSDIDMQILVNSQVVENLLSKEYFNTDELTHFIDGYQKGLYKQFSSPFMKDDVIMECHFWDENDYVNAGTYKQEITPRVRTSLTASTDYGFSFDGSISQKDFFGEELDGFILSDFPSYRIEGNKLYICRPISNLLGASKIQIDNGKIQNAVNESWERTALELIKFAGTKDIDLERMSIKKALLGNNKMSPESLYFIDTKTIELLNR